MRTFFSLAVALAVVGGACTAVAAAEPAPPSITPLTGIEPCPAGTLEDAPVLLIPGTNATVEKSLGPVRQALLDDGRCVYGLEYDSMQPISLSVDYFTAAVERIREINGTTALDVVGKSQGALIARAVSVEFTDPHPLRQVVAISGPQRGGTKSIGGVDITPLGAQTPALNLLDRAAVRDMLVGSPYLTELNSGPMTAPAVRYTMLASTYDQIVSPPSASFVDAPNVTNILIQDGCPEDWAGHLAESTDPRTVDLVLNALDPLRHPAVRCLPNTDER
ncbi:esterase/lipase family protein [Nocardia sp. NPDC051750]|uniref:esterase/lipase family protein n=1 Tax=Nocardia sp. NPDC051750 TaxID=3364325 RepID=UPI0037AC2161